MAIGIHIVHTGFFSVNKITGQKLDKNDPNVKIRDVMRSEHQHRVIEDSAVPSSAGSPTVDNYLKAEAAAGYVLKHIDQTTIITYSQADLNAA